MADLQDRLSLEHPVVQAGMGGGIATGTLAGAVSAAGGLGTVGILPPAKLAGELRRARALAPGKPVAVNLLLPFTKQAHVQACIDGRADAVVLFFGRAPAVVARLRDAGILVLHQVGDAAGARAALEDGADGLIAQGIEAGGHLQAVRPLDEALPEVLGVADGRPVLAAGGIGTAARSRALLDAGAAAVVAGTRFLLTEECEAHPEYQRRVLGATRTVETELFGLGWPARHRVVPNAATDRWCARSTGRPGRSAACCRWRRWRRSPAPSARGCRSCRPAPRCAGCPTGSSRRRRSTRAWSRANARRSSRRRRRSARWRRDRTSVHRASPARAPGSPGPCFSFSPSSC